MNTAKSKDLMQHTIGVIIRYAQFSKAFRLKITPQLRSIKTRTVSTKQCIFYGYRTLRKLTSQLISCNVQQFNLSPNDIVVNKGLVSNNVEIFHRVSKVN